MKLYPAAIVLIENNQVHCAPFTVRAEDGSQAKTKAQIIGGKLFSDKKVFVFVNEDGVNPVEPKDSDIAERWPTDGN